MRNIIKKCVRINALLAITVTIMFILPTDCFSQWSGNPYLNTIICIDAGTQEESVMVSDGAGGAIIAWYDTRNDVGDIYAQHIDANGVILWAANGIPISRGPSMQVQPAIISDGNGGAIITWTDFRDSHDPNIVDLNIYAQRVNGSGVVQWTADGVVISSAPGTQNYPTLTSDGNGGALITWNDRRGLSLNNLDIYLQGINDNGTLKWPEEAVVCANIEGQVQPAIISDGSGGAIITWKDARNQSDGISAADIFAQRIGANGLAHWPTDGVAICEAPRSQDNPILTSDGSGGAIITWQDERDVSVSASNIDIYAQRINASGAAQWAANGIGITTTSDAEFNATIISDQVGGGIIAWQAYKGSANIISLQRVSGSGNKLWMSSGVPIGSGGKESPIIISDGNGGVFLTWKDNRSSGNDIYGQHLGANGAELWAFGGVPISNAYSVQTKPHLVLDNQAGVIVSWDDYRNILGDIYAQHIMADGSPGGGNAIGNQTITFNPIPEKKISDGPFTLGAIASSNLPVTYISSNHLVATVEGSNLTITGVGTSTITANQAGNTSFNAAPPASQEVTVSKGDQIITFNALPSKTPGDAAFILTATASSDLVVSYGSSNTAVATVFENTVTIIGIGTTNITASQAGNANYDAASNVIQPLLVKASQSIIFSAIPAKISGDPVFTLSATSSAGLPVIFSSASDKITITGNQVSIVKAGSATINADQKGNANFVAAPQVQQTFCINPPKPSVTITGSDTETPVLTSSSASGNQWFKDGVVINGATNATLAPTTEGDFTVVVSVDNCASIPSDEKTFVITGIENPDTQVKVYPNPMENQLDVDVTALGSTTPVSLAIYDVTGHLLHTATGNDNINIDVGPYQTGAYVLKIQRGKEVIIKKLRK